MARDDEAGWQAVGRYFPPSDSPEYAAYHLKSLLHLADLHLSEFRFGEAVSVLDVVLGTVKSDKIYQLLALEKKLQVFEKRGPARMMRQTRNELKSLYQELEKNNPDAVRRFNGVIGRERSAEIGFAADDT